MPLPITDTRIRLLKTAFVIYYHADLESADHFLRDFGLTACEDLRGEEQIFYRGYGLERVCYISRLAKDGKSRFGGAAYVVESRDELFKAIKIEGASTIEKLGAPGGGEVVKLTDPVGFDIYLVHGQQERSKVDVQLEKLVVNFEDEKSRLGRFQRFQHGPAPVHKWGHYGVTYPVGSFQMMFDWYTKHLALVPSDMVYVKDDPVTAFFRIDRGLDYTDHHSFFFKKAKPGMAPDVAHAAFEVHDFDIQQLGHQYLKEQGHELCWGVGRHVLGSQIFDYWYDPSRFVVEHYADGDLVNSATPVAHVQAGKENLSIWGPPVPEVF
jgi:hypothetical protein